MNMGVLSHKLRSRTHCGEFITDYLQFLPGNAFNSPIPSYPVKRLDGSSTSDRTYFYRSRSQVFLFGRRFHMISTCISTWFIACFGCLYFARRFGAVLCKTSTQSWRHHCTRQHIRIYYQICSMYLRSYLYRVY